MRIFYVSLVSCYVIPPLARNGDGRFGLGLFIGGLAYIWIEKEEWSGIKD
jgi:hypothetical protein